MEDQRPDFDSAHSLIATGLTVLAAVAAVALRWLSLSKQSLWWDEGFTAWASTLDPAHIVRFAKTDNNPPLYYLLEHFWRGVFGGSEAGLRSLSAVAGTLSVGVIYMLAKKILRDSMAVALAVWLFAFSMMQIWYSQEARSYEVTSFVALVGLYALVLFLEKRSVATFTTIVVCATATLYLHNMMLFYLFAFNIAWLIFPSERSWKQRIPEVLIADAITFVLYLPWALQLLTQAVDVRANLWWVPKPTLSSVRGTLRLIGGAYLDYLTPLVRRFVPLPAMTMQRCIEFLYSLVCAGLIAGGLWNVSNENRRKYLSFLCYCGVPIVMVFLISQRIEPVYLDRVFTTSSAVVGILLAFPLAVQKTPRARVLFGLLGGVIALLTAFSGFGSTRYQFKEDWKGTTNDLAGIQQANRVIIFAPPAGEYLVSYYSKGSLSAVSKIGVPGNFLRQFPPTKGTVIVPADITKLRSAVQAGKCDEVDLVLTHFIDPQGLILDYLDRNFIPKDEQEFYGDIKVFRYIPPPALSQLENVKYEEPSKARLISSTAPAGGRRNSE